MSDLTDRERFCAMLATGTLRRGDAIIVLTGDGTARCKTAFQLLKQGAAPVIRVTGGLHAPPYSLRASELAASLYAMGCAPDRVQIDDGPMHTADQARAVVAHARAQDWHTLLLVASPEHQFRAFLTFVRALEAVGAAEDVLLINVPASDLKWCAVPAGRDVARLELLGAEFAKCAEYQASGDCASWADGLRYLQFWESR